MKLLGKAFSVTVGISISTILSAQDKIFKTDGDTLFGKVAEVSESEIKFKRQSNPDGPYYTIRNSGVDSIVYANGQTEELASLYRAKREGTHLKTNNTYSLDLLGPVNFSVTQWYERRVWQGRIGIRIPLYLCYGEDYSPGFSAIGKGIPYNYIYKGFAFAMGINPKFYMNKHRIIRAFAGPEADLGYTSFPKSSPHLEDPWDYNDHPTGNFQFAAITGININPVAHFNITIEGGVGYTFAFAKYYLGHNPIWRLGLSLGGNF